MDTNGYLLLKNYFTKEEAKYIRNWANQLEDINEEKGKWMIYFEENQKRSRIENFSNFNPHIRNFLNVRIQDFLEKITSKKLNLFKEKMNWKQAGGKGFLAHQDHPAWTDFAPKIYYTVAMFADDSTKDNGCLQFANGNFPHQIIDYDKEGNGRLIDEEKMDWEHIETTSRDLLIFNSFVPHRSDENKTSSSRRIFYFTFNHAEDGDFFDQYLEKKRKEFPPPIERDPSKEYKTKGSKYNLANPII